MKYFAKEFLSGDENFDDIRDIELRECKTPEDASKFLEEVQNVRGLEFKLKKLKKDYEKIILVELYFERKGKK